MTCNTVRTPYTIVGAVNELGQSVGVKALVSDAWLLQCTYTMIVKAK